MNKDGYSLQNKVNRLVIHIPPTGNQTEDNDTHPRQPMVPKRAGLHKRVIVGWRVSGWWGK